MPITKCVIGGKEGYRYQDRSGKYDGPCMTGSNAEDKARNQGLAILMNKAMREGVKSKEDLDKYVSDHAAELAKE